MRGVFLAGTGTGCGKTWLGRGLARALVRAGRSVAALKPVESGVTASGPADALALAAACRRPELAHAPGLARYRAPLSPLAAAREGEPALDASALVRAVRALASADVAIVEGAGGLLSPLAPGWSNAELAHGLGLPAILVAPDALGTLSFTRTAVESALARALSVSAVVLVAPAARDGSERQNASILASELRLPVLRFPRSADDDDALADHVMACGVYDFIEDTR